MKSFATISTLVLAALSSVSAAPVEESKLAKRYSGTATFFAPGLGSCGGYDNEGSMIVAVNSAQGNGNKFCGQTVSITNQETGKSTTAKVTDLCPTCSYGDLDMSPAVFKALGGTEEQGIFPISWSFKN